MTNQSITYTVKKLISRLLIHLKEKKQTILDASLKFFVENGFHGTSTAEIAKTAGVATGTLFHYFKTKEELINRLYLHTKESMLNETKWTV